jgi:Leucine-rich repeat (LRR) protein
LITSAPAKVKKNLDLSNQGISDVSNLVIPEGTKNLFLSRNNITELSGLDLPSSLEFLGVDNNKINTLEGFMPNANLKHLRLFKNQISDFSPLKNYTGLTILDIGENFLSEDNFDFNNLPPQLKILSITGNLFKELDLREFTNLKLINIKSMFDTQYGGDGRISYYDNYQFPETLDELAVGNVERADDFTGLVLPINLKKLSMFAVFLTNAELATLNFNPNLKVLDLELNRLTTLDGIEIPESIRVINLERNNFSKQEKRKIKKRFGSKVKITF